MPGEPLFLAVFPIVTGGRLDSGSMTAQEYSLTRCRTIPTPHSPHPAHILLPSLGGYQHFPPLVVPQLVFQMGDDVKPPGQRVKLFFWLHDTAVAAIGLKLVQ